MNVRHNDCMDPRTKAEDESWIAEDYCAPAILFALTNPSGGASGGCLVRGVGRQAATAKARADVGVECGGGEPGGFPGAPVRAYKPPPPTAAIIEKDMLAFEDPCS